MTDVSTAGALLTFILIWLAIGVVASLVMGRRGHEPATWGVLGAALGPLVIPLAVDSIRREHAPAEGMVRSVESHLGPVDVLVGIDGSLDARQALQRVIELLGSRIGRLTLAAVLDFDTADSPVQWEDRRRVRAEPRRGDDRCRGARCRKGRPGGACGTTRRCARAPCDRGWLRPRRDRLSWARRIEGGFRQRRGPAGTFGRGAGVRRQRQAGDAHPGGRAPFVVIRQAFASG